MRVLFVHKHFPGPFRRLAENFGHNEEHKVLFLAERGARSLKIAGLRRLRLAPSLAYESTDDAERELVMSQRRGSRTANALLRLRKDGFVPELVFCAASDGYSMYLRDVFPESFIVVRADWFFTRGESHHFFSRGKPRPVSEFASSRVRNLFQFNAISDSDLVISSSEWQKEQYPDCLRERMEVIHDGVDTNYFRPNYKAKFNIPGCDLSEAEELLSFSSRRCGPSSGVTQFCEALPALLQQRPQCQVVMMVGLEEGENANVCEGWRHILEEMEPQLRSRVHVVDFLDSMSYRLLLQASSAHVYMTAPYALSSGLFEAMACGALLAGSDTAPVREVVNHGENAFLFDFWNREELVNLLNGMLDKKDDFLPIRKKARQFVEEQYNVKTQTLAIEERIKALLEERLA